MFKITANKNMDVAIHEIMNIVQRMEYPDAISLVVEGFGKDSNLRLVIILDEDNDFRFFTDIWDEEEELYAEDDDGSDFYRSMENLQRDLAIEWNEDHQIY